MESAITGESTQDWGGSEDMDALVMDDRTEWTEELDGTMDPAPERQVAPTAPRSSAGRWALVLLAMFALVGVLGLGTALVVLVAAVVVGGAMLMVPVLSIPEPPAVDEAAIEMVTPVIVDVPATVVPEEPPAPVRAPAARQPAAAPAKKAAPAPATDSGKSEAKLVVMPDPAFRGMPADEAIERLKKKVEKGEAGTVVGR